MSYVGSTRFPFPFTSPLPGDPDGKPAGHSATGIARMRLPGRAHTPNRGLRGKRGKDYESPGSKAGAFGCPEATRLAAFIIATGMSGFLDLLGVRRELGRGHERRGKAGISRQVHLPRLRGDSRGKHRQGRIQRDHRRPFQGRVAD